MIVRLADGGAFVLERVVSWDWEGAGPEAELEIDLLGGSGFTVSPTDNPSAVEVEAILVTFYGPLANPLDIVTAQVTGRAAGSPLDGEL